MKIRLTFKDPDGVDASIAETLLTDGLGRRTLSVCESRERDAQYERIMEAIRPWVKYREYVTIEIDTETGKAEVIPI